MLQKNLLIKQNKAISKQVRKKFDTVLQSLQVQLRMQNINRQQQLQKIQNQIKCMAQKINQFSNLLLQDNFKFTSLEDQPLIMIHYCQIIFDILIKNFNSHSNERQNNKKKTKQKNYNQNNVYQVVANVKLQNFDLREKLDTLQKQLQLSKKRADVSEEILQKIKGNTQKFLQNYKINFKTICDLLKKAQNNEIQLLQSNRFLKEQLQSLTIQFDRYKQYFKQGPTEKDKQEKIKRQLQKQYQDKLKTTIKQVQATIKNQLKRTITEKYSLTGIRI